MIWIYIHEATVDCFPCSIVFIEEFELKSTRKFVTDNHFRYGFSFIHRPIFQNKFSFQLRKEERVNRLNTMNIWCCYASGYALLNSSRERTHTHNEIAVEIQMFCFYLVRVNIILFNIYDFQLLWFSVRKTFTYPKTENYQSSRGIEP